MQAFIFPVRLRRLTASWSSLLRDMWTATQGENWTMLVCHAPICVCKPGTSMHIETSQSSLHVPATFSIVSYPDPLGGLMGDLGSRPPFPVSKMNWSSSKSLNCLLVFFFYLLDMHPTLSLDPPPLSSPPPPSQTQPMSSPTPSSCCTPVCTTLA